MDDWLCPKLPIIWGCATFTTLTSITAKKVPDMTATVTSHFFAGGSDPAVARSDASGRPSVLGAAGARRGDLGFIATSSPWAHFTLTTGTTDMPGLSRWAREGDASKTIFTGMRCTTLTKLPVAFSGGNKLKRAPVPACMLSTCPTHTLLEYVSTL